MSGPEDLTIPLERLARVLQNETHAEGLKPVQWEALRYLARTNRFSRTPSAVAAYLGTTKGTVSQTLNALERKGLVGKETDPANRRSVRLALTKPGRTLLHRDPLQTMLEAASALSAADRRTLAEGLESLLRQTLRRRSGRPFGQCATCRFFRRNAAGGAPHHCGLLDEPLSAADSERICLEHDAPAA